VVQQIAEMVQYLANQEYLLK